MCLLHTNELPLRHVFGVLDGSISPDTVEGPIGKKLNGSESSWTTYSNLTIANAFFVFSCCFRAGCQQIEYGSSLCL